MRLNGVTLAANRDGSIPPVDGVPHAGRVLRVAPLSASLHVFPDAGNAACYTQQQQAEQARGGAKRTGGAGAKRRNV